MELEPETCPQIPATSHMVQLGFCVTQQPLIAVTHIKVKQIFNLDSYVQLVSSVK